MFDRTNQVGKVLLRVVTMIRLANGLSGQSDKAVILDLFNKQIE